MRNLVALSLLAVAGLVSASAANAMTLTSPDIKPGGKIADEQVFNGWDCTGKNVSPALAWSGAPKGTKSFAVSVYDPDAPTGSGFWHWWVANMPADATGLPKGAGSGTGLPDGAVQAQQRFRPHRLRRSLPAEGQAAPLPDHRLCARRRQAPRRQQGLARRLRFQRERAYAGESDARRPLRAVSRKRHFRANLSEAPAKRASKGEASRPCSGACPCGSRPISISAAPARRR